MLQIEIFSYNECAIITSIEPKAKVLSFKWPNSGLIWVDLSKAETPAAAKNVMRRHWAKVASLSKAALVSMICSEVIDDCESSMLA